MGPTPSSFPLCSFLYSLIQYITGPAPAPASAPAPAKVGIVMGRQVSECLMADSSMK